MPTLAITTSAINHADYANFKMNFVEITEVDVQTASGGNALIWDASADLEAYTTDEATETASANTVADYTDGYAVAFEYILGTDLTDDTIDGGHDSNTIAVITEQAGVCFAGSQGDADDDDFAMATACAGIQLEYSSCDSACVLAITKVMYYATDMSDTLDVAEAAWTAVTDDAIVGIEGSWICSWTETDVGEATTSEPLTTTCARFLPNVKESASADLRFDADSDGKIKTFYGTTLSDAVDADLWTWAGAFEAATVAGAAILAVLTF